MNLNNNTCLRIASCMLFAAATFLSASAGAAKRKVFFIGNSYTYTNSMPDMLVSFTAAKGDTLTYSMSAPGGHTFMQHTTNATTLSGITAQPWDIIVLQEQSQLPSFSPAQVATDVYPYARWLDSAINEQDSCIETMFMMTWGRKNGDAMNCPSYTPVCTYAGMQARLRESYMEMAATHYASVAPMGAAWKVIIDSFPAIDLYQADESHPSVAGSYLQACVLYASIFHRSAQGCTYLGGLTAPVAATLQRIADKVTLDSLQQWQQHGHYPYAAYTRSSAGTTVSFTSTSQRATSYSWAFGDGGTSSLPSPSHTYATAGIYTVTLTVTNDCIAETRKDTIHVGTLPTQVAGITNNSGLRILNRGNGTIAFMPALMAEGVLEIRNLNGAMIRKYNTANTEIQDSFPQGVYVYRYYAAGDMYTGTFSAW